MNKKDFPRVHFYDQDFVDVYDRTWVWLNNSWGIGTYEGSLGEKAKYLQYADHTILNQQEQIFASFFLVYSNKIFSAQTGLDILYSLQEPTGAIRNSYEMKTGKPIISKDNPEGLSLPLFAWAEFNLYHKIGNKKRVKEVMPILQKYSNWLDSLCKHENGLYHCPLAATGMENSPRKEGYFLIDFNSVMAIHSLYISAMADILNDKEISFQFKRAYFSIKSRINTLMYNRSEGFYFDLDKNGKPLKIKTLAGFWPLLAELPNEEKAEKLVAHLKDPAIFGTEHPFPTLAANQKGYDKRGYGYRGSVMPQFTFMVIKGLERYNHYELARECSIRHLYLMLDTMHLYPDSKADLTANKSHTPKQIVWEAYQPQNEGKAIWPGKLKWPRPQTLAFAGLSTITLMIENIIGLHISLPRKTVDWIVPNLEIMGIEHLALKRNLITIITSRSVRGWEIRMESEKLYYFTINVLGLKKKTLSMPSGKCSLLFDKI